MDTISNLLNWSMLLQVVIGLLLNRYLKTYISKTSSINTLVLAPIFPYLALVLYALTRVKAKEYYLGLVLGLPLILLVLLLAKGGVVIYIVSIGITCIVYSISDGIAPVIIGLVIGWLCKDMTNPISFIISCNLVCNYIITRVLGLTTNKFKWSKDSYDNDGTLAVVGAGILEAIFVGAPSDVVSNNDNMMQGLADILCISNMLVNGSMRGSSTVLVTNWPTALIFFGLIGLVYLYGELDYVKECDKVWPAQYTNNVIKVPNWELGVVIASLIIGGSLTSYDLVFKFVIIVGLSLFIRIKVTTSLFFSSKVLFS